MQIIQSEHPHDLQSWSTETPPEGYALWPDTLDTADYFAHNGFVKLTIETVNDIPTVTSYEPDLEAWENWKSSLPEPEPERDLETDRDELLLDLSYRLALLEMGVTV